MAAKTYPNMGRGFGRNALDLPVAALAALAVAFVAFAMPADLLTNLVGASGLPSVLGAAEPPLGLKARAGVGAAGALAAFGLVFVLLRLLDRSGLERSAPEPVFDLEEEMAVDPPRLRRRAARSPPLAISASPPRWNRPRSRRRSGFRSRKRRPTWRSRRRRLGRRRPSRRPTRHSRRKHSGRWSPKLRPNRSPRPRAIPISTNC
jgi:hypothetical protein